MYTSNNASNFATAEKYSSLALVLVIQTSVALKVDWDESQGHL